MISPALVYCVKRRRSPVVGRLAIGALRLCRKPSSFQSLHLTSPSSKVINDFIAATDGRFDMISMCMYAYSTNLQFSLKENAKAFWFFPS